MQRIKFLGAVMTGLSRSKLRNLIIQEMYRMMDEDALFMQRDIPGDVGGSDLKMHTAKKKGDCGCGCKGKPGGCMDHDDHDDHDDHEDYLDPGEAFGAGVEVGKHEDEHNYMIAPQLRQVLNSAAEVLEMIESGQKLMPWQESHIAQIADDIEEVHRSLAYGDHGKEDLGHHSHDSILDAQYLIPHEDIY